MDNVRILPKNSNPLLGDLEFYNEKKKLFIRPLSELNFWRLSLRPVNDLTINYTCQFSASNDKICVITSFDGTKNNQEYEKNFSRDRLLSLINDDLVKNFSSKIQGEYIATITTSNIQRPDSMIV